MITPARMRTLAESILASTVNWLMMGSFLWSPFLQSAGNRQTAEYGDHLLVTGFNCLASGPLGTGLPAEKITAAGVSHC